MKAPARQAPMTKKTLSTMKLASRTVVFRYGLVVCSLSLALGLHGPGEPRPKTPAGSLTEDLDPAVIKFLHSKVFPHFSCGRSVMSTLNAIETQSLKLQDLPRITVTEVMDADGNPQWISLNNRRLYVLKKCRELELLENNQITCRVQPASSIKRQQKLYSDRSHFALQAKLLPCRTLNCTSCPEKTFKDVVQHPRKHPALASTGTV
mmetsp:Transcript_39414/g.93313  ORF Transcript_39414/g.93313 Transcript_39414/m.93313 type:complete len:207 (+) Transcript_39414:56-676(+)